MPKRTIRIPALKAGRRLRWTIEVSADDGAEPRRENRTTRSRAKRSAAPARDGASSSSSSANAAPPPEPARLWLAESDDAWETDPVARAAHVQPVSLQREVEAAPAAAEPSLQVEVPLQVEPQSPAAPLAPPASPTPAARAPMRPPAPRSSRSRSALGLIGIAAAVAVAVVAFPRPSVRPSAPATGAPAAAFAGPAAAAAAPPALASVSTAVASDTTSGPSELEVDAGPKPQAVAEPTRTPAHPVVTRAARAEKSAASSGTPRIAPAALRNETIVTTPVDAPPPQAATVVAPVVPDTSAAPPVTITGCLEISVDHQEFRLTDTDGAAAPKGRSWRSGFLRKRSAPVALIDPPETAEMTAHVGKRVAAVGVLAGHDLRVSSVRAVDGSCH